MLAVTLPGLLIQPHRTGFPYNFIFSVSRTSVYCFIAEQWIFLSFMCLKVFSPSLLKNQFSGWSSKLTAFFYFLYLLEVILISPACRASEENPAVTLIFVSLYITVLNLILSVAQLIYCCSEIWLMWFNVVCFISLAFKSYWTLQSYVRKSFIKVQILFHCSYVFWDSSKYFTEWP